MTIYQWVLLGLSVVLAAGIVWLVRRCYLNAGDAIWWVLLSLLMVFVSLFPGWSDQIALSLGFRLPPSSMELTAVGILLIKLLLTDIERSKFRQQARILAQRVAVLEARNEKNQQGSSQID